MVQIREPDLSAREICTLTERALERFAGSLNRVLINDRADIARCIGVGVHLTTRSLPVRIVRRIFSSKLIVGVSTHSLAEAEAAEKGGADFIVLGPVFETDSKLKYGQPIGLESLGTIASKIAIPVLALGGLNEENYRLALEAGAAGVAGISMFSRSSDLHRLVQQIKGDRVTAQARQVLSASRIVKLKKNDHSADNSGL
jgi:thiamine-phosphate pyrophosphorylase